MKKSDCKWHYLSKHTRVVVPDKIEPQKRAKKLKYKEKCPSKHKSR